MDATMASYDYDLFVIGGGSGGVWCVPTLAVGEYYTWMRPPTHSLVLGLGCVC